jgi:DNA-binding GntR family transcriptional regulator
VGSLSVQSLGDQAYTRVREALMRGTLPPGTLVREADLARQFGVSRTPIREALQRLQAEGLVTAAAQRGYVVADLSPEELADVYQVRAVLEALAARLAAQRATRSDIGRLEDIFEALDEAVVRGDKERDPTLTGAFHDAIANASRNRYLQSMLSNIREIFERYRRTRSLAPMRVHEGHADHAQLLAAIRARDAERAAEIASRHIAGALAARLKAGRETESGD